MTTLADVDGVWIRRRKGCGRRHRLVSSRPPLRYRRSCQVGPSGVS